MAISPKGNTVNNAFAGDVATEPINVPNTSHALLDLNNIHNVRECTEDIGFVTNGHCFITEGNNSVSGTHLVLKENCLQRCVSGPVLERNNYESPMSFDSTCRRVSRAISKTAPKASKKKKKKKSIQECEEVFVPKQSRLFSIEPISDCVSIRKIEGEASMENEDSISNGMFTPCNSLTDSEVMRCNSRILKATNSEVGRKIWDSVLKLGVVSGEEEGACIKRLEEMELRDKEGSKGKRDNSNFLP